jgi:DNA-directed RNA polymerase subunit RPC12/RpoP
MAKDDNLENEEELAESEMPDEADVKDGEDSGAYPCPFCGKEVYEDAIRCPNCQRYVSKERESSGFWRWVVLLILLGGVATLIWALMK